MFASNKGFQSLIHSQRELLDPTCLPEHQNLLIHNKLIHMMALVPTVLLRLTEEVDR